MRHRLIFGCLAAAFVVAATSGVCSPSAYTVMRGRRSPWWGRSAPHSESARNDNGHQLSWKPPPSCFDIILRSTRGAQHFVRQAIISSHG